MLIDGRDEEFHRFLGPGSQDPRPTAVICVGRSTASEEAGDGATEVVGWVDHDAHEAHDWLLPHQCNVGYHVFAPHRCRGLATRAVRLLLELLRSDDAIREAVFLVDAENEPSLRVTAAVGASERERFANAEGRPQVLLAIDVTAT